MQPLLDFGQRGRLHPVEPLPANLCLAGQPGVPKHPEVFGEAGAGHGKMRGKLSDRLWPPFAQQLQHRTADRASQSGEHLIVGHAPTQPAPLIFL